MEWIPRENSKGGRAEKNLGESITSNQCNTKFRTRSNNKQGRMAFVLRKTATALIKLDS
jgi:hypothetical protein